MPPIPRTRDEAASYSKHFYDLCDSLIPSRMAAAFAKNGSLYFANNEPLRSRDAIYAAMLTRYSLLEYMRHNVVSSDVVDNMIYTVVSIEYKGRGDTLENTVTIPAAANFCLVPDGEEQGLIKSLNVFIDDMPLREKIAALQSKAR